MPSGRSLKDVKEAIYKALEGREWKAKELGADLIEATYDKKDKGKHILVVNLKYDTNQVEMSYKTSYGLRYDVINGEPIINPRTNSWMKNIASDIGRHLHR